MKNNIILQLFIFFLAINASFSQDTIYNFSVVKNEIVWQKVYESTLSIDQLEQEIRNSGLFEEIEKDGNTFRGSVKDLFPILNGHVFMLVPYYISSNFFSCFAVIEYKTDRYRVTIKNIVLRSTVFSLEEEYKVSNLETHVFLRGSSEYNNSFIRSGAEILDSTFELKFDFKNNGAEW